MIFDCFTKFLIHSVNTTIQQFSRYVELLDKYFGSVCELDIIFNFEKAYFVLDELLIAGEVQVSSVLANLSAHFLDKFGRTYSH